MKWVFILQQLDVNAAVVAAAVCMAISAPMPIKPCLLNTGANVCMLGLHRFM